MKRYIFLLFLFTTTLVYCQDSKIDSLEIAINKSTNNEEKLILLDSLCSLIINTEKTDKSLFYLKNINRKAYDLNDIELITKSLNNISEFYIRSNDTIKAVYFANKAIRFGDSIQNLKCYLKGINQLGRVYDYNRNFNKAIEIYLKGLKKIDSNNNISEINTIYGNLGIAYSQINENQKAIKYFLKQAQLSEKINDLTRIAHANYNIAYSYMILNQFPKAEKYYNKALKDSSKLKQKIYVFSSIHGLGINYLKWGKYNKALQYYLQTLEYYHSTGNIIYEFDVLNDIANVYLKLNNYSEALKYAKKAIIITDRLKKPLFSFGAKLTLAKIYFNMSKIDKAKELLLNIQNNINSVNPANIELKISYYNLLYKIYKVKSIPTKALYYLEKYKEVSDQNLTKQRDSKVTEIETKYQTEKKEKENLQLKAEKAKKQLELEKVNKQKWLFATALGAAILSLAIFAFFYRKNKEQKEIIENLQKDLHHRVKNNLAIIDSLIEDIKDEFDNNSFQEKLTDLQNRIDSINQVHKQLYQTDDITNLKLKKYVEKLSKNVQESFGENNITIKNNIDENLNLEVEKSFPLGLIINEFLTNSFKHAFIKNQKGEITIEINQKDKNYKLTLKDNGKGLDDNMDLKNTNSFGMTIMQLLAKQLNGTFYLKNNNGIELNIQFPKD